ncbi:MAG TPA: TPM domain-containing protein [Opitutales bacterium]|nr:TPM domain-containing protein [Opitutales bacterium]
MRPWLFLLLAWVGAALPAQAAETMPPKPDRYFNDYAGVVSPQVAEKLNGQLENFERETSNQLVVAIFPTMQTDSSLEDYTQRIAESWKVGQGDKNNGAVLFVFVKEHKMRIEVGYGLEGALPDALAKRILDDEITPQFKGGDFNGGVTAGVQAMMAAAKGEYKGTGRTHHDTVLNKVNDIDPLAIIFGFVFLFLIMGAIANALKKTGTVYTKTGRCVYNNNPNVFPWWWGGGGGGGSGGGGGFGGGFGGGGGFSGGGGSFGGGGASGSW